MTRRRWTFRAPSVAGCWMRGEHMAEVEADNLHDAFLLWLLFKGSRVPFTVSRSLPTEQEQAA